MGNECKIGTLKRKVCAQIGGGRCKVFLLSLVIKMFATVSMLQHLSMDNPLRLTCKHHQMDILGEVFDKGLKCIFKLSHNLIIHAVKVVLGDEFLLYGHRHRVNMYVSAMFLVTVPHIGDLKDIVGEFVKHTLRLGGG